MDCFKSLIVVAMLVATASWCHAQQPASANEMVVEASQLIMSAESAPTPAQAISLLEAAHRKLVLITEVHPSSDMAVRLATGQGIGTVSLAGVQAAIKAATEQCWDSLSLLCVARLTVETAMSDDRGRRQFRGTLIQVWDKALSLAAKAQAAAGQFGAAVKTAELIEFVRWRAEALRAVAKAQAAAGQFSAAVKTAELIEDGYWRATAQAAAGQFSAAIETAASIDDVKGRTYAFRAVAEIQTKAGNVADARTTTKRAADAARSIRDPSDRAQALNAVAASYIDMGDKESARATIGLAVEATQAVADVKVRLERLFEIVKAQTKVGQSEAAQQTLTTAFEAARAIEDMETRLSAAFQDCSGTGGSNGY